MNADPRTRPDLAPSDPAPSHLAPGDVRGAFARVATNVAIVTTHGPHGCTANAWAESTDPPVLLVTLRRHGETHRRVTAAGWFAVSLLADDQAPVARRFAGPSDARFRDTPTISGPRGLALVKDALAAIECSVQAIHWFGAYDIVVGAVESAVFRAGGRSLLYGDHRFQSATRLEAAS